MKPQRVKRLRQVPLTGRILVKEGHAVEPDSVVARVETLPGRVLKANAAGALGVEPGTLDRWMLKQVGDHVSAGEAIAGRTDFFERRSARSPIDGVLAIVSRNLGYVYVREMIELGEVTGPVRVDVAKDIRVPPSEVQRCLISGIRPGSIVIKGQILASNKVNPRKPLVSESPIYGRVREVSFAEGTITIAPIFPSLDILAYMKGTVTGFAPASGVEITGNAVAIDGIWGLGREAFGPLKVIEGDLTEESSLRESDRGSIVAVNGTASYEGLVAAGDAGLAGAVLAYLPSQTALRLVGPHRNLGVTGDEEVPFPIVVTEGFLPSPMKEETLSTLRSHQGTVVSLRGITHIRAGVIRPEIIIPVD